MALRAVNKVQENESHMLSFIYEYFWKLNGIQHTDDLGWGRVKDQEPVGS